MISWHKVGQAVECIRDDEWIPSIGTWMLGPEKGDICRVSGLHAGPVFGVYFSLVGHPDNFFYAAKWFRPVYPTVIDQLRKLDVPLIERVKEDA